MSIFKKIEPQQIVRNPFTMIGKDWLLITAEKDGKVNTMTASWGGIGILWNKPVAYIFIRPQRYTKEFVDANNKLSLTVLNESFRKQLNYLGTVSGRDEDKIQKANLSLQYEDEVPFFEQGELVLICRKLYAQELKKECFLYSSVETQNYPQKDYHTMYVCQIEKVLSQ